MTAPPYRFGGGRRPEDFAALLSQPLSLDPVNPVVVSARRLLLDVSYGPLSCPRCGQTGHVITLLDHVLGEHKENCAEAAEWLEDVDADLFALVVHHLISRRHRPRRAGVPR